MSELAYRITDHAREEAERRGIPFDVLQAVMQAPGQIIDAHSNRQAHQSKVEINTSKIEKYWSDEP
jgi:hypothetical protein